MNIEMFLRYPRIYCPSIRHQIQALETTKYSSLILHHYWKYMSCMNPLNAYLNPICWHY